MALGRAQEEVASLRRQKEDYDEERRAIERELGRMGFEGETLAKANESLVRELQQMAEDDEIIRQKLDRAARINTLKNRNEY